MAKKGQHWIPRTYQENASFVSDLGVAAVELLAPRPGENILDLGCGDGRLTERIAAAGATVLGVDASPELLAAARIRGLAVAEMDGQALEFDGAFDAVFSNAALHWMLRPDQVVAGVHRALKPGGRFVAEMGGHGNVAAIVTALLAVLWKRGIDGKERIPWYFPTVDDYAERLVERGFRVDEITLFPRPVVLPTDMKGWLTTFAGPFFQDLPPDDKDLAIAEALDLLAPSLRSEKGRWTADYVRLRFKAVRLKKL